jgi:hypothetical protein
MPERNIQDSLQLAHMNLRFKKRELQYTALVPKEAREEASRNAQLFAGELLAFIKNNPTGLLAPLHLTFQQFQVVDYLLDSAENEALPLVKNRGIKSGDREFHVATYQTNDWDYDGTFADRLNTVFHGRDITYATRWDHDSTIAPWAWISGRAGRTDLGLEFIATDKKLETSDALHRIVGFEPKTKQSTTEIGLFQNGERLIINHEIAYKQEDVFVTEQYYLLGAFDGEDTNQTYWLYGNNHDKHYQQTSKEKVGAVAPVAVRIRI